MAITSLFFSKYSQTTLEDTSSYQLPVLAVGTPTITDITPSGTVGNSSYFSGIAGNYYYVQSSSQFPVSTQPATFECWINVSDISSTRTVFSKGNTTDQVFVLKVNTNGSIQFYSTDGLNIISTQNLLINTWYHIAITIGSGSIQLWVNGVLDASSYSTLSPSTSGIFYIGTNATNSLQYIEPFYGYIANVRIYSGILYSQAFTPTFYLPIIENVYSLTYDDEVFEQFDVGVYIFDRQNKLEVCQNILNSIGGHIVTTIDGNFKLIQITDGTGKTPKYTISDKDIYTNSLELKEKLDVYGAVKLGYCKNWTVQSSGLAAGLAPESAALYSKSHFYATDKDLVTLEQYAQSGEPPVEEGLLIVNTQAQQEATRRLNLKKSIRYIFSVRCYSHMLLVELGDYIELNFPDRFNLSNKIGTVISTNKDWFAGIVTMDILVVV